MSDQLLTILAAIDARLTTYTATGQDLEAIKSFFVKHTASDVPPEFISQPPVLMVDPLPVAPVLNSIPPCSYLKPTPIRFQLYTENAGDTTNTQAATILDAIEDVFFQQKFGISTMLVDVTDKNYDIPTSAPFQSPVNGGAALTITYTYEDIRTLI